MNVLGARAARVVLVDDHPMMRMGVRRVLESASGIEVVGEASTGEQALLVIQRTNPDVVFLDIGLPDTDGVSLLASIRGICARAKVVILSCLADGATVHATFGAGANGYLTKSAPPSAIVDAVRDVCRGQVAASADVVTHLAAQRHRTGSGTGTRPTAREQEVWRELSKGRSNKEIAAALYLSEHTVKFHVHNLLRKLEVRSRAEAVYAAHQRGIAID